MSANFAAPGKARKFKVGDKVKAIRSVDGNEGIIGMKGGVLHVDQRLGRLPYLVEFDKNMGGHTGNGLGGYLHCWWCDALSLILVKKVVKKTTKKVVEKKTTKKVVEKKTTKKVVEKKTAKVAEKKETKKGLKK